MVQGHHLQCTSYPPMFHNLWQFNVKAAAAHHPIIQKEMDELLSKGEVESSSGGAGFFSSMFVVSKHTGGYWSILNLKWYIVICIYLILRCLLSDICGSLFSMVIMFSPLIYRMLIYVFLLLGIIVILYSLFGTTCLISRRFYILGWPQPPGFSQPSLNLSCSFAIARVSIL